MFWENTNLTLKSTCVDLLMKTNIGPCLLVIVLSGNGEEMIYSLKTRYTSIAIGNKRKFGPNVIDPDSGKGEYS